MLDRSHHLAVQFPRCRMEKWTLTGTMVMLEVNLVRTITYRPLRPLLNSEEPELAIAFA